MDAPKCKICGVAHWSNQPHVGLTKGQALVVAKKSASVRKDVPGAPQRVERAHPVQQEGPKSRGAVKALAGTQAPPVDTHSSNAPAGRSALEGGKRLAKKAGHATRPAPKVSAVPDGGSTKKPKLKRGRPSTGFDKKAYQRDLMRDRRAKAKEAKT